MFVASRLLADGYSVNDVTECIKYAKEAFVFDYRSMQIESRIHVIYRLLDASGRLLYVGISNDLTRRLREHAKEKSWWHEVRGHFHVPCADREDAQRQESLAIQTENPKYNIVGRGKGAAI